jgi:radical SAM protein with 4Fe4S-binding SPASM domain
MNFSDLYNRLLYTYGLISSKLPYGYALPPIRATIEITYNCNLRCQMCYLNTGRKVLPHIPDITEGQIKHIINQMPPKTLIGLTGGEIFTKPYIFNLINYASRFHYCNIVTNGTLINREIANKIVNSKLLVVGISIDGPKNTHNQIRGRKNAFDKTLSAIKLIQQEKKRQNKKTPNIDIKIVILPENYRYLKKMYQMCQQLAVDFFTISVLKSSPIQLSPPVLPEIEENTYQKLIQPCEDIDVDVLQKQINWIVKNKSSVKVRFYPRKLPLRLSQYYQGQTDTTDYDSCIFPWASFNISPNGSLFPCISLDIGDVTKVSLNSLWNSNKMRNFRQKLKKNSVFPACHGCCNLWFTKVKNS